MSAKPKPELPTARTDGGPPPGAASCSVIPTTRTVIEGKLLDALTNDGCVAILASEDDLRMLISALSNTPWEEAEHLMKARAFADGLRKLLAEAFPPNANCGAAGP